MIFFRKTIYKIILVFVNSFYKVSSYSDIKSTVTSVSQDINIRVFSSNI